MRKIAVFLVWGLVGLIFLSGCRSSAPTSVARDLIQGLEDQDKAELKRAYCSSSLAELSSQSRERIRFEDTSYIERSRQNNTATVEVRGTVRSADGTTSIYWRLTMKKTGTAWCVESVQSVGHA